MHPDELRKHRDNVSVLKVQLARLREKERCRLVIVLEGKEDLPVYDNWINRIDENFDWEPMVANGKKKALEFREMLGKDTTGMSICTYFIVDHDYDGLCGFAEGGNVYVLPAYSVENFLVQPKVLDAYLKTELRVVSDPDERAKVVDLYVRARDEFFGVVRDSCVCLYGAKNEPVGNVNVRAVGNVVYLDNGSITVRAGAWLDKLVTTDRAVSDLGKAAGEKFLMDRGCEYWIRGKFVLDFFKDFCRVISEDRNSDVPTVFSEPVADKNLAVAGLDIRSLSSKSPIPPGFADALKSWTEHCANQCAQNDALVA